ncbi:MAG: type II secretion system F family protein [Slackia sp.]|nr:type II secretion system F family protein [Slackia sp.]
MATLVFAGLCAAISGSCFWLCAQAFFQERKKGLRARSKALGSADAQGSFVAMRGQSARASLSRKKRALAKLSIERHVPEMVDAVALGMRAGLSFESSFALYCDRFDDELAAACRRACLSWESGLVSRDEALRRLAQDLDVSSLTMFVNNVMRCLRFGSPMSRMFEIMASEARSCYRAKMEEMVAKAPVKMLVPTAALILPAMLIVVMGPLLLEFL